jgi:ApbE superfamily uncharacterized protein (UPF0280 family)
MRSLTLTGAALVATFILVSTAAACESPAVVAVPDGKTATKEQMLAARDQVKAYMKGMEDFMTCVDQEAAAKGDGAPEEYKNQMAARHNAAVSEMEAVAGAFNDQLHAYNAAHPAPPKN